ncbi:MAG: DUF86 domain-containing protein [Anaerolineae bacterium]|nr:DUF86 domain-containing protein [Anaerolineae bacterium]
MSKKTPADYLRDLLSELNDITEYTRAGRETFAADNKTRKAVIRSYEVIGEIAKRLPDDLRENHPHIPWSQLIRFRDFLAHHYDEVILETVWVAVEDLPTLRAAVEALLAAIDVDDDDAPPEAGS